MGRWLREVGGIWVVISGAAITLVELAGVLDVLRPLASTRAFIYSVLVSVPLLLATTVVSVMRAIDGTVSRSDAGLDIGLSRSEWTSLYPTLLGEAEEHVSILGLSLPSFQLEDKLDLLGGLVSRGLHVRILLMNPLSPGTRQRPTELYATTDGIAEAAIHTLSCLVRLRANLPKSQQADLEIGLMPYLPGAAVVASEKRMLWSPYLATTTGAKSPYLVHDAGQQPGLTSRMARHFDRSWEVALKLSPGNVTSLDDLRAHLEARGLVPSELPEAARLRLDAVVTRLNES